MLSTRFFTYVKDFLACDENIIGEYLELYIPSKTHNNRRWVHCVDSLVKATDFVKYDNEEWHFLQVKNRYNSENSSSAKIRKTIKERHGIEIKKWYRMRKNGTYDWSVFPNRKLPDKQLFKFSPKKILEILFFLT